MAALTTPQVVISEQPNTIATSQPPRASAASFDVTSSTQTRREERQPLVMSTSFIQQQIEARVNDLMQEVSKQLVKIVKLMVQNELQMFQQQQKEMLQTHGQSIDSIYANTHETINETMAYTGGHQGPQLGQVQIIKCLRMHQ